LSASPTEAPSEVPSTAPSPSPSVTPSQSPFITIKITFDDFSQEIGWILKDEATGQNVVHVPYLTYPPLMGYVEAYVPVENGGSYSFEINDFHGDGLCCPLPGGSYAVEYDGTVVTSGGGDFGYKDITTFSIP
jgi:hypothetical protein